LISKNADHHPWKLSKTVLPQHTDHAGVMWHGAYVSWLEEARIEALSSIGLPYKELSSQGLELPVVSLKIKYIKAANHGDQIEMHSFCLPRNGIRLPWKTTFLKGGISLLASAEVELVLVKVEGDDKKLMKTLPLSFYQALSDLQKGP